VAPKRHGGSSPPFRTKIFGLSFSGAPVPKKIVIILRNDHPRHRLFSADHHHPAAAGQERRSGCGFRRTGFTDSLWTALDGEPADEIHDLAGGHFRYHFHYPDGSATAPDDTSTLGAVGYDQLAVDAEEQVSGGL
jgi:hypothetical protein